MMTELLRHRRFCVIALFVCVLFAIQTLWAAMYYHGRVPLGRDYYYFYADSGIVISLMTSNQDRILNTETLSVGPNVDRYRVCSGFIVGHVSKQKDKNFYGDPVPVANDAKVGYFIVNVRNDCIYDGLKRREWLRKLRQFGVHDQPRLYRPSIYDQLLRRNRPTKTN